MRKTKKRFLSALLACAMIVGLFPFAAFAGDAGSTDNIVYIDSSEDLVDAIQNQANGQTWVFTQAGTYNAYNAENYKEDKSGLSSTNQKIGGYVPSDPLIDGHNGSEYVFPIYVDNLTIKKDASVTGDVILTSTATPNEAYGGMGNYQDFITVAGTNVTIEGVDIQSNINDYYGTCNKAIELVKGKNLTLKDINIIPLDNGQGRSFGGSIYFNVEDAGASKIENLTMDAWISASVVKDGSIEIDGLTQDFSNSEYAGYNDNGNYGWNPVVNGNCATVKNYTIIVDDKINLNEQVFNDKLRDGATVQLMPGTYEGNITIDESVENLTIEGTDGAVIKNGSLTVASNGIDLPGLTIKNLDFENANIQMSPNGNSNLSGMTIKDNTFTGAVSDSGLSAIHFNFGSLSGTNHGASYDGLTITGNDIKNIQNGTSSGIWIKGDGTTESDLTIDNNVIDGVAWNGIQLNNIKGDSIAVKGNEIKNCGATNDGVLNLYNTTSNSFKINENKIYPAEGQLYVSNISGNVDLNDNYWGIATPDFEQGLAYKEGTTSVEVDEYYKAPTMQEEDLNTYVPPYTGKYSYAINVADTDNGSVSVDKYATEGEKVTLAVSPDKAYKLDELTLTANGKEVEVTDNGDGTYTFTMPSGNVKVSASFV
ncbi:MAG: hypothetical protein UDG94_05825, partial [Peptococcaceae bacterium]|nr:hypothetical protein [Peptococcaceae bacterium]